MIMTTKVESPLLFKISILGDEGIGKDKFINLFTTNQFLKESDSGLGVAFYKGSITLEIEKGEQECIIWIWDLKERERFRRLHSRYLRGTNGVMLFFDLTNRPSFNKLLSWIEIIKNNIDPEIPILLVGNKESVKKIVVSPNEINTIVRKFNLYYIETSLTTKEGIFDSFYCITSLSLGVEVDNELFMSKDIIYYPRANPLIAHSSPLLSSKDLSNMSQKIIFKKFDSLEKTFEKSTQIKIPLKMLISQVILAIGVLGFFIVIHFIHALSREVFEAKGVYPRFCFPTYATCYPLHELIPVLFFLTIIMQIVAMLPIILSYFKHRKSK